MSLFSKLKKKQKELKGSGQTFKQETERIQGELDALLERYNGKLKAGDLNGAQEMRTDIRDLEDKIQVRNDYEKSMNLTDDPRFRSEAKDVIHEAILQREQLLEEVKSNRNEALQKRAEYLGALDELSKTLDDIEESEMDLIDIDNIVPIRTFKDEIEGAEKIASFVEAEKKKPYSYQPSDHFKTFAIPDVREAIISSKQQKALNKNYQ